MQILSDSAEPIKSKSDKELPESVTVLTKGEQTFYIVGTAHVSRKSVEDVEQTIESVQPDAIVVELCQARLDAIQNEDRWKNMNIYQVVKSGKGMLLLANLMLSSFQKKIGDELGVKPGEEMMKAVAMADESGARLLLGDRDVQVTLKRTWNGLSLWEKTKLIGSLGFSSFGGAQLDEKKLEEIKREDTLTEMLEEMGKSYPAISERLIHERDLYLMNSIFTCPGKDIVAIVGAGHVPGIQKHWGEDIDLASLQKIPGPSFFSKSFKWLFPLLILIIFTFGFLKSDAGWEALSIWFFVNGGLAALGALIALGHPLTIFTAFVAAPFTSINPLIGAGHCSGIVEAIMRKPTVQDCMSLQDDATGLKGFYKNRITRVLLVAAFSTIGSALGTWIATAGILNAIW